MISARTSSGLDTETSGKSNRRLPAVLKDCLRPLLLSLPGLGARQERPRRDVGGQTARDVMLPLSDVPSCDPDTTIDAALERMLRSQADALLVMDRSAVAGTISLADVAGRMHQEHWLPSIQRVGTHMRAPTAVPADMPLPEVRSAAADSRTGLVIVIGTDGAPGGYLTAETLLDPGQTTASGWEKGEDPQASRAGLILPGEEEFLQALAGAAVPCG